MTESQIATRLPLKNLALALIFSVVLGPIGLLYATTLGGVVMLVVCFVVFSSKLFYPILLSWLICCVWSVMATNTYNKKIARL